MRQTQADQFLSLCAKGFQSLIGTQPGVLMWVIIINYYSCMQAPSRDEPLEIPFPPSSSCRRTQERKSRLSMAEEMTAYH